MSEQQILSGIDQLIIDLRAGADRDELDASNGQVERLIAYHTGECHKARSIISSLLEIKSNGEKNMILTGEPGEGGTEVTVEIDGESSSNHDEQHGGQTPEEKEDA